VYTDGTPGRLHAGDRAPEAPGLADVKTGEQTTLFDIFQPTQQTVIVFDPALAEAIRAKCPKVAVRTIVVTSAFTSANAMAQADGEVFMDSEGHAALAYCVKEGVKAAIVRPDGIVGGLLKSAERVDTYFVKVFSAA
jgi:hypothetical protein